MNKVLLLGFAAWFLTTFAPQLRADDENDYTGRLINPSFEYDAEGNVLNVAVSGTLRGTPPGWQGTEIAPPATGTLSYGINRGGVNKDGYNLMFCAPTPFPREYELYQTVEDLPAGEYLVFCRMVVFTARLANQRLFAQTLNAAGDITANVVQYFGKETDYELNLTPDETNTYAGWDTGPTISDGESRLKPMSLRITVAAGDKLRLGVKSGTWRKDGSYAENSQEGFIKADDFRLVRVAEQADNYTHWIANPSFELEEGTDGPVQITAFSINNDKHRGTPYGWSDINIEGLAANPISYGVNSDGNNQTGAKSCWAMKTPFPDHFTLYQDITGLPAGRYRVSCSMFIENGRLTTQRLFANDKVQYYGRFDDYSLNLTEGEISTYAGWDSTPNAYGDGQFLRDLSVEVEVQAGEPLRIGVKTGNLKKDGSTDGSSAGWFRVDNFRLKQIESTQWQPADPGFFTLSNQKGGFWVNTPNYASASIRVTSLSGQTVYRQSATRAKTWVKLPQGVYIVRIEANGREKAAKVLVY